MIELLGKIPSWLVALGALLALLAWELRAPESRPINQDALDTMESIVRQCRLENAEERSPGCSNVLYLADYCNHRGRGNCEVSRFYRRVTDWGFSVPPLHIEQP
jgi:hypothetical protein